MFDQPIKFTLRGLDNLINAAEVNMPRPSTPKQAKTMSAISHGWKPSQGDIAKIPVGVAKHLHAEGAGTKYGAKHKESKKWASRSYAKAHSSWKPKSK